MSTLPPPVMTRSELAEAVSAQVKQIREIRSDVLDNTLFNRPLSTFSSTRLEQIEDAFVNPPPAPPLPADIVGKADAGTSFLLDSVDKIQKMALQDATTTRTYIESNLATFWLCRIADSLIQQVRQNIRAELQDRTMKADSP